MERDELWQRAHDEARSWLRRYPDPWTRTNQEDLVQEASIAAWRWASDVRHRERFWAAVQTIASRIRGRALRLDRRVHVSQVLVEQALVDEPSVAEHYWTIAGRRVPAPRALPWLQQALAKLKGLDRQLLLSFHEGFCCAELAERFRRSESWVKTRLHRARRRIQRHVEGSARAAGALDG